MIGMKTTKKSDSSICAEQLCEEGRLVYTYREVALLLGMSRRKLERCVAENKIGRCKLGRHVRFTRTHLEEYLAIHETRNS
jgi:excisionase family DNA binding protein